MKEESKPPLLGSKKAFITAGIGILLLFSSLLVLVPMKLIAESGSDFSVAKVNKEKLIISQSNTLLSVSAPPVFDPSKIQKVRVILTGYSSTPEQTDDTPFITASGSRVRDGIVANNYFPFGTEVRIPEIFEDKIFTIEDRMHWTKDNYHFDIWFSSYKEALEFGKKTTYLEILND
jgi:3D (Asp-Asp-Asp) domain-containing protein